MTETLGQAYSPDGSPPNEVPDHLPNDAQGALRITEAPLPTVVSAAWELELVIAGGVTFALFQLPGSLDALRLWAEPRASQAMLFVVFLGYVYAKVMVYVLIAAFVTNLTARAYWVGLV